MPIKMREHEIVEAMTRFKNYRKRFGIMDACKKVAGDMGIPYDTIYALQYRMRPTTEVAQDYIKSQALRLAVRVVRKANVDQAMNILSRPNMGVLDPAGEGGGGGGRQFMIGVAVDSLGSVKVGVQIGESERRGIGSSSVGEGGEESESGYIRGAIDANVEEVDEGIEGEQSSGLALAADGDGGRPPISKRWYRKDPPKPQPEPVPLPEGHTSQGHIGRNLEFRLAQAKAQRKQEAKERRKERENINKRAKELAEQIRRAREAQP